MTYGPLEGQTLTVGEVFNYEVGDEFHIRSSSHSAAPVVDRLTVIEKSYSKTKDTVFYSIANNGYTYDPWNVVARIDTQKLFYTSLSSPIFDAQLNAWEKELTLNRDSMIIDTISTADSALCSTSKNAFHARTREFEHQRAYAKGLGFIYDRSFGINGVVDGYGRYMFYFKKGNATCGKPDLKNSVPKNKPAFKIQVFPNPASDALFITSTNNSQEPVFVEILSLKGETLMNAALQMPTTKLSIKNLPAGTYLVRSKTSQLTYTELVVKQ